MYKSLLPINWENIYENDSSVKVNMNNNINNVVNIKIFLENIQISQEHGSSWETSASVSKASVSPVDVSSEFLHWQLLKSIKDVSKVSL